MIPAWFRPHTLRRAFRALGVGMAALTMATLIVRPTQDAIANGDTRTISLYHTHTRETLDITFKRNGAYDPDALKKLNWFLRDWRRDEPTRMDPRLFDIVWAAYREVGGRERINVISAYRAPETNAMLRRRSRGVAKFSQHTLGKAMDFFIPGVALSNIRVAGLRLQRGGVGFYPTSGSPFVHLDAGSIRMWPRMTRDQLAQVFPDGKTVHIPADGKKMPRYDAAFAELKSSGAVLNGQHVMLAGGDEETGAPEPTLTAAAGRPIPSDTVMMASADTGDTAAQEANASAVPMPAQKPDELSVAAADDPTLVWQAGAQPVDSDVPMPVARPGDDEPEDLADEAPVVVAAAELPDDSARTLATDEPPLSARAYVQAGPAMRAAAIADPIGAFMPDGSQKSTRALTVAAQTPATQPATTSESAPSLMIATRFEAQDFGTVSRPMAAARDKRVAVFIMPDLRTVDGMIAKPGATVVMRFGVAPYQDLRADEFSGPAIRPLRTASYDRGRRETTGSIAAN